MFNDPNDFYSIWISWLCYYSGMVFKFGVVDDAVSLKRAHVVGRSSRKFIGNRG